MSAEDGTKRFNAEISIDLDRRIKKCIPYGLQAETMRSLLEVFVESVEERGAVVVHHLLAKEVKLAIVIPTSGVQTVNTSKSETGKEGA